MEWTEVEWQEAEPGHVPAASTSAHLQLGAAEKEWKYVESGMAEEQGED